MTSASPITSLLVDTASVWILSPKAQRYASKGILISRVIVAWPSPATSVSKQCGQTNIPVMYETGQCTLKHLFCLVLLCKCTTSGCFHGGAAQHLLTCSAMLHNGALGMVVIFQHVLGTGECNAIRTRGREVSERRMKDAVGNSWTTMHTRYTVCMNAAVNWPDTASLSVVLSCPWLTA
jgi:hypothetical protein